MFGVQFNNPNSVFCINHRKQLAATLTVNILTVSHGIALGWVAPMLPLFQSIETPLSFDISLQELSWIASIVSLGGIAGNLLFGTLLERLGRKKCLFLLALPQIIVWLLVLFAQNVYFLYFARLATGITGGGIFVVMPIFISEISDCLIRGRLSSLFSFSVNLGILLGFILSSYVPYYVIPYCIIVLPITFCLFLTQFPETPQFLFRRGCPKSAADSLKFYKNYKNETKEEFINFSKELEELQQSIEMVSGKNSATTKDFFTKRSLKPIGIGIVLMFLNITTGTFPIMNYSSLIFAETGATMNPNTGTIIIGVVQLFGSSVGTTLVDNYGRKILCLLSLSGMCLGLTAIGVYIYLFQHACIAGWNWLPPLILSFVIFSANIGIIAVSLVVLIEILPPKVRSGGTSFCLLVLSVFSFATLKVFPLLMANIGLAAVMWTCALISAFGFCFTLLCIKETKGRDLTDDSAYD